MSVKETKQLYYLIYFYQSLFIPYIGELLGFEGIACELVYISCFQMSSYPGSLEQGTSYSNMLFSDIYALHGLVYYHSLKGKIVSGMPAAAFKNNVLNKST